MDSTFQRRFLVLEQLFIMLTPKETALLQTIRIHSTRKRGYRINWHFILLTGNLGCITTTRNSKGEITS